MNRKERREKVKEINALEEVINIIRQYFPELLKQFDNLTDTRHQGYVVYKMKVIFLVELLGLMSEIKSMNELGRTLNTVEAIENIASICGVELEELPHPDTISNVFKNIEVSELEEINKYIVCSLIRSKMLDKYRIREKYFHIVVDGTGIATSRKKYNDNCIVKNKTDKRGEKYQEYSTYVLEAKLVVGSMVFSIGSEFVENNEDIEKWSKKDTAKIKQDCEINAFKRLAVKIKKQFPRLNMIISGDALYAKTSIIDVCKENNWRYIITFKEGTMPNLYRDFEGLMQKYNESKIPSYEMATNMEYKNIKTNVIRHKIEEKQYIYITDLPVSDKNIEQTINLGRKRWKIENEGFNAQKNGTFDICHLYSKDQVAIKVHYLLIQIAHTIRQLLDNGSTKIREIGLKIKEISTNIKKTLISKIIKISQYSKIQLRFYD